MRASSPLAGIRVERPWSGADVRARARRPRRRGHESNHHGDNPRRLADRRRVLRGIQRNRGPRRRHPIQRLAAVFNLVATADIVTGTSAPGGMDKLHLGTGPRAREPTDLHVARGRSPGRASGAPRSTRGPDDGGLATSGAGRDPARSSADVREGAAPTPPFRAANPFAGLHRRGWRVAWPFLPDHAPVTPVFLRTTLLALTTLLAGGCATVSGNATHPISIQTVDAQGRAIEGMSCRVNNESAQYVGDSPMFDLKVRRSSMPLVIECRGDGRADGARCAGATRGRRGGGAVPAARRLVVHGDRSPHRLHVCVPALGPASGRLDMVFDRRASAAANRHPVW